eukprot:CAMPEP_0201595564 /NCGR_PEP_ID=MMETSP0190_2-20130828/192526_1 /ASSEMBLY_ACC=CAM_ASM_000263 /TAXON_ID=37353 /ORGANISM="Rosalina sp." /LENGTH=31 /DNA_ID= /DNA_START= /DNA_END= /DNA_ORIENTATION=
MKNMIPPTIPPVVVPVATVEDVSDEYVGYGV